MHPDRKDILMNSFDQTSQTASPYITKNGSGLDGFRLIAAFLVVSIHTSIFSSFSEGADFWFTRILARIAVPFFLMVTGFFLLSRKPAFLLPALKKLLILYGLSIIIYLPLNLYSHQLSGLTPGGFLKSLLFDGTFYHLWYFPAVIEGLLLVFLLQRLFSPKICLWVTFVLYLIGLLGDSYYGLAIKIPGMETFYDGIFRFSSYTRNGIFLVPFFLCLGWILSRQKPPKKHMALLWFFVFLLLMTAEGFLLRQGHVQRHDSMYLSLIPCMYCLFSYLRTLQIHRMPGKSIRSISMYIYVIHPWMIVLVRMVGKLLHLEDLLIHQSLIHYLAVLACSFACAVILWKFFTERTLYKHENRNTER